MSKLKAEDFQVRGDLPDGVDIPKTSFLAEKWNDPGFRKAIETVEKVQGGPTALRVMMTKAATPRHLDPIQRQMERIYQKRRERELEIQAWRNKQAIDKQCERKGIIT